MKNTGMVRKFDDLGRLSIPKEIRKGFYMNEGDSAEFFTSEEFILIRKYQPGCIFCWSVEDVVRFKEKPICSKCANEL